MLPSVSIEVDRENAREQQEEIVWYADDKVLKTLVYMPRDQQWAVIGYLSVAAATGSKVPNPTIHLDGVGYTSPPVLSYLLFAEDTPISLWQTAYKECTNPKRCPIQDIHLASSISICANCSARH